jgi:hypothetical protein
MLSIKECAEFLSQWGDLALTCWLAQLNMTKETRKEGECEEKGKINIPIVTANISILAK